MASRIWFVLTLVALSFTSQSTIVRANAAANYCGTNVDPQSPALSTRLPNGMRIVISRRCGFPLVAGVVVYRVGSADDPYGKSGLAHAMEHMSYRARRADTGEDDDESIFRLGGRFEAETTYTETRYSFVVPLDRFAEALLVEAGRLDERVLLPSDWIAERHVIEQERADEEARRRESDDDDALEAQSFATIPPATIGSATDLRRVSTADLHDFAMRWYRPNNATLVISGPLDPTVALREIQRQFGSKRRHAVPGHPFQWVWKALPRLRSPSSAHEKLKIHFQFPGTQDRSFFASLVAMTALQFEDSPLNIALRKRGAVAIRWEAGDEGPLFQRLSLVLKVVSADNVAPVLGAIRRFARTGIDEPTFQKARRLLGVRLLDRSLFPVSNVTELSKLPPSRSDYLREPAAVQINEVNQVVSNRLSRAIVSLASDDEISTINGPSSPLDSGPFEATTRRRVRAIVERADLGDRVTIVAQVHHEDADLSCAIENRGALLSTKALDLTDLGDLESYGESGERLLLSTTVDRLATNVPVALRRFAGLHPSCKSPPAIDSSLSSADNVAIGTRISISAVGATTEAALCAAVANIGPVVCGDGGGSAVPDGREVPTYLVFRDRTGSSSSVTLKVPLRLAGLSPDSTQLAIFSTLLSGTQSSDGQGGLLWKAIRKDRGLVYSISGVLLGDARSRSLSITFQSSERNRRAVVSRILQVLRNLQRTGPTASDVAGARDAVAAAISLHGDSLRQRACLNLEAISKREPADYTFRNEEAVTRRSIERLLRGLDIQGVQDARPREYFVPR